MSSEKLKIHFIGIGGIGVSALAKYYLEKGCEITGSDLVFSEIIEALRKKGAKIFLGPHKAKNLPKDVQMVIYSPAVQVSKDQRSPTNPELKAAKKKGIKCLSYPQALGELTKKHFTIAVSGSHGKSTTASMIGLLLVKAGLDPTVIVGTKLKEFGDSNCRVGKSKYLVIEADEYMASFLNYWPKIIVITNIEADHLDYYKNLKNLKKAFNEFISHLPKEGVLITNKSIDNKAFLKLKKILKVPGIHNIYNASLALAVARILKIPDKISFNALSEYKGSWRRFEIKELKVTETSSLWANENYKLKIISDYAHHPTEIRMTLEAARKKYPKKKIWCIYQPHQYQRTYYLFKDFVKVFREALVDKLIITDIYEVAGREDKKIKEKVNSKKLIEAIKKSWAIYLPKEKIIDYLKKNLKGGEVVIIMGAGDIYNLALKLTEKEEKRK
jgi:UDP-N-acetylmuramate--alanine ligase